MAKVRNFTPGSISQVSSCDGGRAEVLGERRPEVADLEQCRVVVLTGEESSVPALRLLGRVEEVHPLVLAQAEVAERKGQGTTGPLLLVLLTRLPNSATRRVLVRLGRAGPRALRNPASAARPGQPARNCARRA